MSDADGGERGSAGRWVVLEGGEGSGKSTQARLLADALGAVLTREPGGTPVGSRVRAILLDPTVVGLDDRAEALLMAADRAQHVNTIVGPAIDAGRLVVGDRSAWSSLAYQGYGRGLEVGQLHRICDWAMRGRWPDLVVLVDVEPSVAKGRLASAGRVADRFEAEGEGFHERVRQGFSAMAVADPLRWAVVDGNADEAAVSERILAVVSRRLGRQAAGGAGRRDGLPSGIA